MNKSSISRHIMLLAAVLSAAFSPSAPAATSENYIQKGLIAHWDGIENVGRGQHSDATAVWTDLVGGRSFALSSATIREDSIVFSGASSSYGTLDADGTAATFNIVGQKGMIEMVFKYVSGAVFLQSTASSGVAMGFLNSTTILPYTGGNGATGLSFPSSLRGLTNTVSVGYTSTRPVITSYYLNGASASTTSGSYWSSPGSVTYIGRRASGAASSVALYAIRLYDRHLSPAEIAVNRHVDERRFILKQESEAPELPYCVATANENLSATFAFQLACGGGSDTADISLALGRAGDAMATNLLAASLASGYHECTVEGLRANTAYQAVLLARNENGFTTNGPAMAFETGNYPADETGPGRTISIAATNRADGAVASLDLAFGAGEEGVANQLYALLGLSPGGLVTGAWKRVVHLGAIAPETTSYHYDLPSGWGSDYRAVRFAFDLEKELPYDGMVEYIESTGAQWIDTGVRGAVAAGGGFEATADMAFLASGDVGFLASRGGGGGRCYLIYINGTWTIGYGGAFTGGGSLSLGVRYRVESVLHDGWQSISANGAVQKTATYSGAVDSGCNLHVFRTNNNNSNGGASKARLYSLTLSRMGTLLRDYIPCTTNGAGALYDRVTHTVFPNKSSTPFTLGRAVPLQCYVPFSPTFYHVDEDIPSIAEVALSQLTGSSFTIAGSLESFGGTREGCRVRLHIGTEGPDGAFSQYGEAVVPAADGTVSYDVTGLTGGTTYWYYLEVTSSSGAQAVSPPASVKTPSFATVSASLRSVVKSTLTVGGAYQVQGASAADVVLLVGHDAASATAKASTNLLSVGDEYTFVWEGYKDACDWSKLHYWQVRAITATGDAAWTNVCGSGTFQLQDSNAYEWTGGGEADAAGFRDWADTNNWATTDTGAEKAGAPVHRLLRAWRRRPREARQADRPARPLRQRGGPRPRRPGRRLPRDRHDPLPV